MDNQTTIGSDDSVTMCPEWGKGSVLEDLAREFYEQLGKIVMCSQGRMFFNAAKGLESEYAEEIGVLESKETRTEAEQTRLEILRARESFVLDAAQCAAMEKFFFSMDTPAILHLPEDAINQTKEWLFGTIFSEVGAAHACELERAIGSTVPEGPEWKFLGKMDRLHMAAYYVYDMYYEAMDEIKRKENFTDNDLSQARILNARCSLAKSFFFTVLREEVARKDPGSEGSTIGGDGGIYSCGSRDRVIARMNGKE